MIEPRCGLNGPTDEGCSGPCDGTGCVCTGDHFASAPPDVQDFVWGVTMAPHATTSPFWQAAIARHAVTLRWPGHSRQREAPGTP
jgi:hypothetical protein